MRSSGGLNLRLASDRLVSLLMPSLCPACLSRPTAAPTEVCRPCGLRLQPFPQPRCPSCGGQIDGILEVCGRCAGGDMPPWDRAVSVFPYGGLVRELVHRFKYRGAAWLAPYCARRMVQEWQRFGQGSPHVVVPVPLHWTRRLSRGYNQAGLLAECIARGLGVPVRTVLRRRRRTPQQALLDFEHRRANMRDNVFKLRRQASVAGAHILVIDDVMTTGATLAAAVDALSAGNPGRVSVLTLARG